MERAKKIILFIVGLLVIPTSVAFLTAFIFKIDLFDHALVECLCFDYVFAYILTPLLYKPRIQKYISNRYVFFALTFFVFWLFEVCRIQFLV